MNLNEVEVNNYLKPFLGRYEDSFQEAWVDMKALSMNNSSLQKTELLSLLSANAGTLSKEVKGVVFPI